MNTPVYDREFGHSQTLSQSYLFSSKKIPNTGLVSISLLLSGGQPLIGGGADGD